MSEAYRDKCLSYHDEECIICGRDDEVHVHHVGGDVSNGSLLNLIPVCISCHSKIHAGSLPRWSDKLEETNLQQLKPLVEDRSWSLTMYWPFSYRKVVAGSRGRVTLGSEYEEEPLGVTVTPLTK